MNLLFAKNCKLFIHNSEQGSLSTSIEFWHFKPFSPLSIEFYPTLPSIAIPVPLLSPLTPQIRVQNGSLFRDTGQRGWPQYVQHPVVSGTCSNGRRRRANNIPPIINNNNHGPPPPPRSHGQAGKSQHKEWEIVSYISLSFSIKPKIIMIVFAYE